jgi:Zn-dependent M32 family carboxypeptidase
MARKNNNIQTCYICGKQYDYCEHCAIVEPDYNANRFCSHEHQDVFAILSKHGCNLATAEETLEALNGYDVTNVTEVIQTHISKLKSEVTSKVVIPTEVVEEVVEEVIETPTVASVEKQYNKNNKKKW